MQLISIHDPIHGTIEVSRAEIKLIDSRALQRLRGIKQLGFADLAFPGATHSRYAHSLGAMHVASQMLDRLLPMLPVSQTTRAWLRQVTRLAVLFHDLGHPPLSHVSECVMPPLAALHLGAWQAPQAAARQATHEDYTIKLLVDSELSELIDTQFGAMGISGAVLAALICGRCGPLPASTFVLEGQSLLPLLSQIVSSELDADRMDYLRRDAYCCGVSYGQFDHLWLTANLVAVQHEARWVMALQHKAVWAFENFLLARYHMFLTVYYHHTPICFDYLLGQYYQSGAYQLPADAAAYLECDDVHLWHALRASSNPWARQVVRRRAYRLLVESHDYHSEPAQATLLARLQQAGIRYFCSTSRGILSKYFTPHAARVPLLLLEPEKNHLRHIETYTPLYQRFAAGVHVARIYCVSEDLPLARRLLRETPAIPPGATLHDPQGSATLTA